jgi:glycosyltransferase involved in cell wall biosynthesis
MKQPSVTSAGSGGRLDAAPKPIRLALIVSWVAPYTKPLYERLAQREECELLVVSETAIERDRRWEPERDLPFENVLLDSWELDLARFAVGSGFRTRFDTYLYVPKRPLRPLLEFEPDVIIAAGGGIWSSPANIAALAARSRGGWAIVPWWGSFTRPHPTWPRRLADSWVRHFMRTADACLVYGSRHARDLAEMGVDPDRIVLAPITALGPERPQPRESTRRGEETRFLFVGRLIERKGLDVLFEAFANVDGGELWIAGDGPLRDSVEVHAAQDPRITTFGHVAGQDLVDLYAQVDALVVPSLYEAWGLVVHEALASGLSVITTDQVGAADDLLDSGVNGYIVPAGSVEGTADAMRKLAEWGPDEWYRAIARSTETIARCSIERGVEGFLRGASIALEHRAPPRSRLRPVGG